MQVSEDTFELGKAIGQLLRGDARGAKTLWLGTLDNSRKQLERESDFPDTLTKAASECRRKCLRGK